MASLSPKNNSKGGLRGWLSGMSDDSRNERLPSTSDHSSMALSAASSSTRTADLHYGSNLQSCAEESSPLADWKSNLAKIGRNVQQNWMQGKNTKKNMLQRQWSQQNQFNLQSNAASTRYLDGNAPRRSITESRNSSSLSEWSE